jgi:hypothetical protein
MLCYKFSSSHCLVYHVPVFRHGLNELRMRTDLYFESKQHDLVHELLPNTCQNVYASEIYTTT